MPDGDLLLALGYAGPGELDTHLLLLSSGDGTGWAPLPGHDGEGGCADEAETGTCPDTPSYPVSAVAVGGEVVLAIQEQLPSAGPDLTYNLRTSIYRSVATAPDTAPPDNAPPGVAPLRARLELPATTLRNGTTVDATVVVQNDTGRPVEARRCGTLYAAELKGDDFTQEFGEALCGGSPFTMPVGESRWPVKILVMTIGCSAADAERCAVTDGQRGPVPLPTGAYTVVVTAPGEAPIPEPVTVQVE